MTFPRAFVAAVLALLVLLFGCGGGGGGGGTTGGTGGTAFQVVGRVIWVATGSAPNPVATVQIGTQSANTDAQDGSFTVGAESGASSLLVIYRASANSSPITFTFAFATVSSGVVDVGDLWIGPDRVTIVGRVLSTADNNPIAGASVQFAGRSASTDASGQFSISEVAYDSANTAAFFGIEGRVTRSGFNTQTFFATSEAVGGVVTIPDVFMSPESDPNPPPVPYNIWGMISPTALAPGTIVQLRQGGVLVRQFTVGSDARYAFWAVAGDYVVQYSNPGLNLSAPDESVTLSSNDQVVRRDVLLR